MITKLINKNWILLTILILAAVLRLYDLGKVPSSLMWDETALGYNAFSILKTGRDEYGRFLPLIFKSFGDFKPGLYIYLAVPSVAIFGLTEFAVRLPSALLGTTTVFLVYLLVGKLFSRELGILSALTLSISPWHIEFSRGAWEANLAIFLMVAAIWLFLQAQKESRFLPLSATLLGLTFFSYQGAKVFTPLLVFGFLIFYRRNIRQLPKKVLFVSTLVLVILALPVFLGFTRDEGGRAKVMSIFSYPRQEREVQEILKQDQSSQNSLIFTLFHSESLNFARGILERYFNHFSGQFLFFEGDWSNKRLGVPYLGVMYIGDIFFLIVGIHFLIRLKDSRARNFLFYWLLVSPIPAAITRDSISSVRALNMVVPLTIIVGFGIYQVVLWLKHYPWSIRCLLSVICCLLYGWNFVYFLDQYFIHAPIHNSSTSQYGYREVVKFVAPLIKNYNRIIFTQKYGQPYIYWLFYTKYPPSDYQKQAHLTESPVEDVGRVEHLDKIEFRNIYWPSDRELTRTLFVGDEFDLPTLDIKQTPRAKILREINFLDGRLAFRILEKNEN